MADDLAGLPIIRDDRVPPGTIIVGDATQIDRILGEPADDCPLTDDARGWLDALERGGTPVDRTVYDGTSLRATINRDLLNRLVAAELAELRRIDEELG